ncbi:MAG TPA: molybdenum cofactor biosynthesis protein MoaE [Allosphingosinicella sp.]
MIDVRVQAAAFDPGRQLARLDELGAGRVVSFTAAAQAGPEVASLFIDHHPPLARNALARIAAEAEERWSLTGAILIHRHGRIAPGERLAFAAVAAADGPAALEACAFLAEALRTRAPFWRREILAGGGERWR